MDNGPTSLTRPTSISVAAFTGATWKSLGIPKTILERTQDQQRGWVSWRVRKHYRVEEGKCSLFGDITGYRWHFAPEQSMEFDGAVAMITGGHRDAAEADAFRPERSCGECP